MTLRAIVTIWLLMAGTAAAQEKASPPVPAPAQKAVEPRLTWNLELDISSRYIWHGLPFSTGTVVWPWASISAEGFTATLWTNLDSAYVNTTAFNPQRLPGPTFNEYDIAVSYERTFGKVTATGTFNRYTYREAEGVVPQSTSEVIARVGLAAGPGELFTTHSFDVEKHRGAYYFDVGYAFERELGHRWTLKADGSIAFWSSFAKEYGVTSEGPMGPATLNIAIVRQLTPWITVRPHATFLRLLDEAARNEQHTPGFIYGIAVTFGS